MTVNIRWLFWACVAGLAAVMLQHSPATPSNVCGYTALFVSAMVLVYRYRTK